MKNIVRIVDSDEHFDGTLRSGSNGMKLLVTLGGGGYLWEAQKLIQQLGNNSFRYAFVTGDDCMVPDEYRACEIYRLKSFATIGRPHYWQTIPGLLCACFQAYKILLRSKPDCVLCVAAPSGVPLGVAARMLNIRLVFVESVTRFERPSLTARIVMRLGLADRFYVQWPDCISLYPDAIYRGTVL